MTFRKVRSVALQCFLLYATWLVLSGRLEAKYLLIGALSAGLVAYLSTDLVRFDQDLTNRKKAGVGYLLTSGGCFFLYVIWLIFNIIKANLQVAYLVLHPRMPIRPGLLRFRTRLRSGVGYMILANSSRRFGVRVLMNEFWATQVMPPLPFPTQPWQPVSCITCRSLDPPSLAGTKLIRLEGFQARAERHARGALLAQSLTPIRGLL